MNWYYVDGPRRLGPLSEDEWTELVRSGKIQTDTLVWREGLDTWVPYGKIPVPEPEPPEAELPVENAEDAGEQEEEHEEHGELPAAYSARLLKREYSVDIGSCLSRAWRLLWDHFWMLVGSTLLMSAVVVFSAQVPGLDFFVGMALQGVLFAGLCVFYLRLMRGQHAVVTDLAAGFNARVFRHLTLKTLISFVLTNACFIPLIFASKGTGVTLDNLSAKLLSDPNNASVFVLSAGACLIPVIFFSFIWMFALPLIIDKHLPFWPAMELSRRKVMQHPFKVGVLTVVAGIFGMVGLIFTIPVYFAATLYLYEDMFGEPDAREEAPEPEEEE